jgi:hypothetical protein
MTTPPDLETQFRKRAHKLPSPLTERFDVTAWERAFALCDPSEDDRRLLVAALWIGEKARVLYETRPVRFPELGPSDAVILAIAVLNREYRILSVNARNAGAAVAAERPITLDHFSNVRFENVHGQSMSSGDFIESAIDALDAWLFDARRCLPIVAAPPPDLGEMVEPLIRFYAMRHILKRLYDKALHLGHFLNDDGIWVPRDRGLATLHQAWFARAQAVFGAAPAQLLSAWSDLPKPERLRWGLAKSVTDARRGRHGIQLKVQRLTYLSKRAPHQALVRIGLRQSYVADFLDQRLPLAPLLTAALIEDGWWVCRDAGRALAAAAGRSPAEVRTTGQYANAIQRGELVGAVGTALEIEDDTADSLVSFLTYGEAPRRRPGEAVSESDHGWRGLWTAPLVEVPHQERLLLPSAVFEHCAPLFRVEAWLEKGGLGDQGFGTSSHAVAQRGNQFELSYRAQLCRAVAENSLLGTSRVAANEIKREEKEGGFPEQIDILFKLGHRLFVGEVKFLLTPADPHQWRRHYEKLASAAAQARGKAAALSARLDITAAALGLTVKDIEGMLVTPLVILSNGFGFSLEIGGCRVVDAMYLRDFLLSPDFSTGGALSRGKLLSEEVTTVYLNERDAAERFDTIMARPGVLTRFLNRVRWDVVDYPSEDGIALRIDCPFRGDMTPAERARRKALLPDEYG